MVKTRKIKLKSIENEEIIMENDNDKNNNNKNNHNNNNENEIKSWNWYKNIKALKQNKKCSIKSNLYLLKWEKRSESYVLLENKNHLM